MKKTLIALILLTTISFTAHGASFAKELMSQGIQGLSGSTFKQESGGNNRLPKTLSQKEGRYLRLDYQGYTLWMDCERKSVSKFRYNAQRDQGNLKRKHSFELDPYVPSTCQQTSANTYKNGLDRGHMVPANHLDHDKVAIAQSNYMTNILPQAAGMNRGAWYQTEMITECYRDESELLVLGGPLWGTDRSNDVVVRSHGIETPDAFWKVIINGNGHAIAWIIPNVQEATKSKLDSYLVTVAEVERLTGERIPVDNKARNYTLKRSWSIPTNCNKG